MPVRAEYDSDWYVFLDHPTLGSLGYCTGADEEFAPTPLPGCWRKGGAPICFVNPDGSDS
ncbi:hypothetical protein ACVWXU_008655 [Streptomyces sp. TE33382]